MENQAHGLVFEDQIIKARIGKSKQEYQAGLDNSYTASMDIEAGVDSDVNISVKVCSGDGIGCGDILRFMEHCRKNPFTMVVGVWEQISPTIKRYETIYEFDIRPEHYKLFWNNITEEVIQPFVDYVKSIPPGKQAQTANQDLWKQKRQAIYDAYGQGLCTIATKIDSKNQRRVQCSINLKELIEQEEITHRKYNTDYYGISLPYEQESTPRQRKKT